MLTTLFDSPAAVAIIIVVVVLLNYALTKVTLHDEARQHLLERAGATTTSGTRRPAVELAQWFGMAIAIIALSFFIDSVTQEVLAGGYLVMQTAAVAMNIDSALRMRALLRPGVAEGRLVVSKEFQNRSSAARMVAMAAFCGMVALLFRSMAFAAGCAYLLATAVGWYRRAHQSVPKAV